MDIKKSILIIKANPRSLSGVESFLRNREWVIGVAGNIKDALTYIMAHKPSFVMVAMDHPVKKIRTLPKLLAQNFQLCVIGFAENATTAGYQALQEAFCDYKLNPPVTGPAVERTVNKYIKDLQTKEDIKRTAANINVQKNANEGAIVMKGQTAMGGRVSIAGDSSSTGNYTSENTSQFLKQISEGDEELRSLMAGLIKGETPQGVTGDPSKVPASGVIPTYSEDDFSNKDGAATLLEAAAKKKEKTKDGAAPTYQEIDEKDPVAKGTEKAKTLHQNVRKVGGHPTGWEKSESLMGKAVQKAMDESVQFRDGKVQDQITVSSQVACIIVESENFSGYLVAAMGRNRKIDAEFILSIKERLFKFLKDHGENVKPEDNGVDLNLRPVEFESWAIEYADFLRKSVHNGDEVAMAFFPFADAAARLGESISNEMGSVKIEDLRGDLEVEFNLYIYLPTNKRFVLYTPRGSKFYENQKGRLKERGVTHMHMRKSEAKDLSKYRAQNYLNEKIREYEEKVKSRKKVS